MKKQIFLLGAVLIILPVMVCAQQERNPQEHDSGLLVTSSAIGLSQSDFNSGSYRITQPGYYYFTENINFEPDSSAEAFRTDKPDVGWFTGISIECDNVILDLNTKTFEVTQEFIENQNFKVFSLIELGNTPFPHLVFAFKGETELLFSKNVTIKNGTLGRNSHHGIHGNSNSNVQIYDLVLKDFEVSAIAFNAFHSGIIKNVDISGVEHQIPFTGLLANITMARMVLQALVDDGDVNAQPYLDDLDVMFNDDNQNGKNHPSGIHDSNTYGIFINRVSDVGPIAAHCEQATSNNLLIENVTVSNIHTEIIETVGIVDNNGILLKGKIFGTMRWIDAYPSGSFAPNALLRAQVYGNQSELPVDFVDGVLNTDESKFLSSSKPEFEHDFPGHIVKGAFGIRLDCGHGVTIKNCNVSAITNSGAPGQTLTTLPGGSNYSFEQNRYKGNDVYGISLAACHNCRIIDCCVTECSSTNGYVRGISLINESDANFVVNCNSSDHYALRNDVSSEVNPSSQVYGFCVDNKSNCNEMTNCASRSLESPRFAYGYFIKDAKDTCLNDCLSFCHTATSNQDLDQLKEVAGFNSITGECNSFRNCESRGMRCANEESQLSASQSQAVGFLLVDNDNAQDFYGEIKDCKTECNDGGAGKAVGILLDGAVESTVINNSACTSHSDVSSGSGYGIQDTASNTSSLFLKNIAWGNETLNYDINFLGDESLPLTAVLYGKIANLHLHNKWDNISIEHAPGQLYNGDNTSSRTVIRQVVRS